MTVSKYCFKEDSSFALYPSEHVHWPKMPNWTEAFLHRADPEHLTLMSTQVRRLISSQLEVLLRHGLDLNNINDY